jgi:hypothetical protein
VRHFFSHSRNRVAVQLQKNLDRVRLRRIAHKLTGSRTGGFLGGLPGQLLENPRKKKEPTPGAANVYLF